MTHTVLRLLEAQAQGLAGKLGALQNPPESFYQATEQERQDLQHRIPLSLGSLSLRVSP